MDIEKQVFTIFSSFIRNLSKTFPEIKNCLYRNYESEITGKNLKLCDCPKIQSFLDKVHKNNELIRKKDEELFRQDVEFLEEISFQLPKKQRETYGNISNHLQSLQLI